MSIPSGEILAEKCIAGLQALKCDPLLLFWLKHMYVLDKTLWGGHMLEFTRSQGLTANLLHDVAFCNEWYSRLRREANKGIFAISPSDIIRESGVGGKERALAALKTVTWTKPFQPFCFQSRGVGPSEFVITKTFQDGLIALRDIYLATRDDKRLPYVQLLEHSWGDERMCRLLIDWEIEECKLDGAFSLAEVQEMAKRFPFWFAHRLYDIGAVASTAGVRVAVKNKSRATDKGFKVSYHFIVNVVGIPKGSHQKVCYFVFQPWQQALSRIRTDKNFSCLDEDDRRNLIPVWGVDIGTLHGSQGFSTLVSRKLVGDPLPTMEHSVFIGGISMSRHPFPWTDKKITTEKMLAEYEQMSLVALYRGSYTPPDVETISYELSFLREKVGGTLGLSPFSPRNPLKASIQSNAASRTASTLPSYLAGTLNQISGFRQYSTSPCLDGILSTLVRHLDVQKDDVAKFGVSRLTGCPCPVHLAKSPPSVHVHGSNGVFVAWEGDNVYFACSYCKLTFMPSKRVELVKGTENTKYNWFKYTARTWRDMMADTRALWLMQGGHGGSASATKRRKTG